uniref:Uncharacterized protein n=1 Tax=Rhizophora mucronata TaxID=61149 RepID=A0A2P2MV00_RHIMU
MLNGFAQIMDLFVPKNHNTLLLMSPLCNCMCILYCIVFPPISSSRYKCFLDIYEVKVSISSSL